MADVLEELAGVLRRSQERLTPQEEFILLSSRVVPQLHGIAGCFASSYAAWFAARSLPVLRRFTVGSVAAVVGVTWTFRWSSNRKVNQILELKGTRLQRELAMIILSKHSNDVSRMKIVNKHFYSEKVFSDSDPDKLLNRWRYRNTYADSSATHNPEAVDSKVQEKPREQRVKQITRTPCTEDMIVDPLDFILGLGEASAEIPNPDAGSVGRRRLRAHKRAHHRHRACHTKNATVHTNYGE